ncbi:MAG: hypothetical protein ACT4PT_01835 [Methanobacteriota archaeon]
MRPLLLALALVAPALAGCLGPSVEPTSLSSAASTVPFPYPYVCPGREGDGAREPCLTQIARDDAVLQQPFVAIHPGNPEVMAVAANFGSPVADVILGLASGDASAGRVAVYVTEDGGATWRETFAIAPATSADPVRVAFQGDVSVLFDSEGSLHVTALATHGSLVQQAGSATKFWGGVQDLRVYYVRSDDLGKTWGEPVLLQDNGVGQDRPFIVRDPTDGVLYTVWQDVPVGALGDAEARRLLHVAWSLDHGVTWRNQEPGQRASCGREGMPVVFRDALLFACTHQEEDGRAVVQIYAFDSASGNATLLVGDVGEGWAPFLTVLADGTLALHYDTCYPSPCDLDTMLQRSRDGGLTWEPAGGAMAFSEDPWDYARVYWSAAGPFGDQHLLVRYARDQEYGGVRATARFTFDVEMRHVVLDRSGAVVQNVHLAEWRHDDIPTVRPAVGLGDDGYQQHPRCSGASCYYGLAWGGERALLAFMRDGAIVLAEARAPTGARPLAPSDAVERVARADPSLAAGLDEPIAYAFAGHVDVPSCYVDEGSAPEKATHDASSDTFSFEVPPDTRFVNGTLDWETHGPITNPVVDMNDLDVVLYDPDGELFQHDSGPPETFSFELRDGEQGEWTAIVYNCENPPTDFTLTLELS